MAPRSKVRMTFTPPEKSLFLFHFNFIGQRCQHRSEQAALPAGGKKKTGESALRRADGIRGEVGER